MNDCGDGIRPLWGSPVVSLQEVIFGALLITSVDVSRRSSTEHYH